MVHWQFFVVACQGSGEQNSAAVTQTASKNENSTTQAVDKVKDAVVSIITYSENSQGGFVGTNDTDTDSNTEQINSEGSGVIYKKDGDDAYLCRMSKAIRSLPLIASCPCLPLFQSWPCLLYTSPSPP